jgi:hypothetical protein
MRHYVTSRSSEEAFAREVAPAQHELSSFDPHDDRLIPSFSGSKPVQIGREHESAWLKPVQSSLCAASEN